MIAILFSFSLDAKVAQKCEYSKGSRWFECFGIVEIGLGDVSKGESINILIITNLTYNLIYVEAIFCGEWQLYHSGSVPLVLV